MLKKNILVVAAHMDDEALGVGGTIAKHVKKGNNVYVCFLSESATARYNKDMINVLREHAKDAGKILGIKDIFFFDFKNIQLNAEPILKIVQSIESCIKKVKPDIIYTHHRSDVNSDHKVVFEATIAATRPVGEHIVNEIYCYEVPSSTDWVPPFAEYVFNPNVFEDISETINIKIKALDVYETEMKKYPHPRSSEAITTYAKHWGIKIGRHYAEAFELVRLIRD